MEEAGYYAMKYFASREDYLAKAPPLGSVDLRTLEKFTYVVCPFYSPALSLPFLIFCLRSEKTRRLSIEATK